MRACVHACKRANVCPDLSGPLLLHLCMDFKIFNTVFVLEEE